MNIQNTKFVKSVVSKSGFIHTGKPTIAFAGKSNVGKSSVINRLLGRKNYARVGAQPGKTVHINYFDVDDTMYFVDLPGYGYAKVAKSEKERWGALMEQFFATQGLISLGILIVDSRHKPTADDVIMAQWFAETGCPVVVVANKCDKLKKSEMDGSVELIRDTLPLPEETEILLFSAEKGTGKEDLMRRILSTSK